MTKKFLIIFNAILLLLLRLPVSVDAVNTALIEVKSINAAPGETVDIQIFIKNNPGITALQIDIGYSSEDLQLINIKDENLFGSSISSSTYSNNPFSVSWFSNNSKDEENNGLFCTMTFKILEQAKTSEIAVTYDEENIFDMNYENVNFNVENGTVYISESGRNTNEMIKKSESYDEDIAIIGDVDKDGVLTIRDATFILRYVNDIRDENIDSSLTDINNDGKTTDSDAILIQKYIALLTTCLNE